MKKKLIVKIISIVLAIAMPIVTCTVMFAGTASAESNSAINSEKKYESPDINELTGHGQEPEELSVSAGAEYLEKAWYEYVT